MLVAFLQCEMIEQKSVRVRRRVLAFVLSVIVRYHGFMLGFGHYQQSAARRGVCICFMPSYFAFFPIAQMNAN